MCKDKFSLRNHCQKKKKNTKNIKIHHPVLSKTNNNTYAISL